MTDTAELHRLVALVARLRPDWRDPEEFYEVRSEVMGGLRRLAVRLNRPALPSAPLRPPPPPAPTVTPPVIKFLSGFACRCSECGKGFRAARAEARTCSHRCRQRAYMRRRRKAA
jgi:hypothetical protein